MKVSILAPQVQQCTTTNQVSILGIGGVITVLSGHEPCISTLRASCITISETESFFVYNGVAQINTREVILYADFALQICDKTYDYISDKLASLPKNPKNIIEKQNNKFTKDYLNQLKIILEKISGKY